MIRFALAAEQDLEQVERYSFDNYGPALGDAYVESLLRRIERIAELPGMGSAVAGHDGLRRVVAEQHLIFYRVAGNDIEIARILHQRMDADFRL